MADRRLIVEWSADSVRVQLPEALTPAEVDALQPLLATASLQASLLEVRRLRATA